MPNPLLHTKVARAVAAAVARPEVVLKQVSFGVVPIPCGVGYYSRYLIIPREECTDDVGRRIERLTVVALVPIV